jgi:hypothetical protein
MAIALAWALQAAAAASAAQAPAAPVAVDFDLARYRPGGGAGGCGTEAEILVCGRRERSGDYPMERWARVFAQRPLVAEARLGGNATGRVFVDSAQMPNGMVSNRVMVGVRIPF